MRWFFLPLNVSGAALKSKSVCWDDRKTTGDDPPLRRAVHSSMSERSSALGVSFFKVKLAWNIRVEVNLGEE